MNTESEIRTVMTLDPFAVKPDTSVARVKELFDSEQIHHMPVVDDNRKVVGIVSSSDLYKVGDNPVLQASLQVKEIMFNNPITVNPSDTLGLIADMFLSRDFHAAPVVEDDMVVGIITTHDLIRKAYGTTFSRTGW